MYQQIVKIVMILPIFIIAQNNQQIEDELLQQAQIWTENWNGKIDKNKMLSQYHKDMQYYWRGQPMSYEVFEEVLENDIIPNVDYDISMSNAIVTVIDENTAVVSFNFKDSDDGEEPPGAVSITFNKQNGQWKIYNVHESVVNPMPVDDFEQQFNSVSLQYTKDYMSGNCEGVLPYLDESLVIYENGESWDYKKVKEFCPHLPEKPIQSTFRDYRILTDNLIYEYVSHNYQREGGDLFNESQAIIWKYSNGQWKIIELGVTRYKVKQ